MLLLCPLAQVFSAKKWVVGLHMIHMIHAHDAQVVHIFALFQALSTDLADGYSFVIV